MSSMAEHGRIARYFAPLAQAEAGSFSLTDDAAWLTPPAPIVVTTDSVIEGIHVLYGASAEAIAQKLVRRNLSDLAAMGAAPWRYLVNLHTPAHTTDDWFARFAATLAREQQQFGMVLAGGDSTSGGAHVHATLTCFGTAAQVMLRSKAQHGDDVYVSGTIGDAALGLHLLLDTYRTADIAVHDALTARYHLTQPRLALGAALHGIATACLDISDGLLADAGQLARASNVQVQLNRAAIPLSAAARVFLLQHAALEQSILTGGDDYELLFTAPPAQRDRISALANHLALPLTRIGTVAEGEGVLLDGTPAQGGWEHR